MKNSTDKKKAKKTASLNLRVSEETKEALRQIGQQENRTLVNTVEWLVAEYHRRNGATLPPHKREDK